VSRTTVVYSRLYSRPIFQIGEVWISREKRRVWRKVGLKLRSLLPDELNKT
jgi:hypothetical protein